MWTSWDYEVLTALQTNLCSNAEKLCKHQVVRAPRLPCNEACR